MVASEEPRGLGSAALPSNPGATTSWGWDPIKPGHLSEPRFLSSNLGAMTLSGTMAAIGVRGRDVSTVPDSPDGNANSGVGRPAPRLVCRGDDLWTLPRHENYLRPSGNSQTLETLGLPDPQRRCGGEGLNICDKRPAGSLDRPCGAGAQSVQARAALPLFWKRRAPASPARAGAFAVSFPRGGVRGSLDRQPQPCRERGRRKRKQVGGTGPQPAPKPLTRRDGARPPGFHPRGPCAPGRVGEGFPLGAGTPLHVHPCGGCCRFWGASSSSAETLQCWADYCVLQHLM